MKYAIGIDLGGTNIKGVVIDRDGKVYKKISIPGETDKGRKVILNNILKVGKQLMDGIEIKDIAGIGIGSPGLISPEGKVITGAANLKGWNGTDMVNYIKKFLPVKNIKAENDVTALALGEAMFGAGKNYNIVLCAAIGTGLGGGIVINKKIYRGKDGYAGEFGHITLEPDGFECTCGKRGCLEAYASSVGIKNYVSKYKNKIKKSEIFKKADKDINKITPKIVFDCAKEGDKLAMEIVEEFCYHLAWGFGILTNIFNPDVIIVAGGISLAGKFLLNHIKKHINQFVLKYYRNKVKLKLASLGAIAGAIGSASLIFQDDNK